MQHIEGGHIGLQCLPTVKLKTSIPIFDLFAVHLDIAVLRAGHGAAGRIYNRIIAIIPYFS